MAALVAKMDFSDVAKPISLDLDNDTADSEAVKLASSLSFVCAWEIRYAVIRTSCPIPHMVPHDPDLQRNVAMDVPGTHAWQLYGRDCGGLETRLVVNSARSSLSSFAV